MAVLVSQPPCVIYEDEHLLGVHKPPGLNTHAPSPYAGEGIHEWLKHREPRWAKLAIIHRLDKGTSGVMVFAKTREANRSLTEQFATRKARKSYQFFTAGRREGKAYTERSCIVRAGERYLSRPPGGGDQEAITEFKWLGEREGWGCWEARPLTGRTHQIRVHAAAGGIPVLGDEVYGGAKFTRLCLHARELRFQHPVTGEEITLIAEADWFGDPAAGLRKALIDETETNAFRLLHGSGDGMEGIYLDRWGESLLLESEREPEEREWAGYIERAERMGWTSLYYKALNRQVRRSSAEEAEPRRVWGQAAEEEFAVRENGVQFGISFQQGYSVGLFLDQRENRRRLLTNHAGAEFDLFPGGLRGRKILNTFAYTCGFSVCAALGGAATVSLDLSRKYLDWGRRNFRLNGIDQQGHEFIQGDVFDWARRFEKKERKFDLILLDPPTFSHAKGGSVFQAEKHYGKLVGAVLPLLAPEGILFASTNAQKFSPEAFQDRIESAAGLAGRKILQRHYVPQPPDFPVNREEPAYLKTMWLRIQ